MQYNHHLPGEAEVRLPTYPYDNTLMVWLI